jgi:hypothetical protein
VCAYHKNTNGKEIVINFINPFKIYLGIFSCLLDQTIIYSFLVSNIFSYKHQTWVCPSCMLFQHSNVHACSKVNRMGGTGPNSDSGYGTLAIL